MTHEEFEIQMGRMRGVFGKASYDNPQRIEMIWRIVGHMPAPRFVVIVDQFIASARRPPLPAEFKDAVASDARVYSGALNAQVEPYVVACGLCQDMGVVMATEMQCQIDTLLLCGCSAGENQPWKLPHISDHMAKYFRWTHCPADWFRPKAMPILDEHDDPDDISKRIMGRLNPIVDQWRGKVYVAQDFWTYHNNRETYGHVMPKTTDVGW